MAGRATTPLAARRRSSRGRIAATFCDDAIVRWRGFARKTVRERPPSWPVETDSGPQTDIAGPRGPAARRCPGRGQRGPDA